MKVLKIITFTLLLALIADALFGVIACYRFEKSKDDYTKDWESLRRITAEAYININESPDFVNTATAEQPMNIPDTYYTSVESALGYGHIFAVVYEDGTVEAYMGTPEKTLDYLRGEKFFARPRFPFIFNAVRDYYRFGDS